MTDTTKRKTLYLLDGPNLALDDDATFDGEMLDKILNAQERYFCCH